jgi:hypothetical protein
MVFKYSSSSADGCERLSTMIFGVSGGSERE